MLTGVVAFGPTTPLKPVPGNVGITQVYTKSGMFKWELLLVTCLLFLHAHVPINHVKHIGLKVLILCRNSLRSKYMFYRYMKP